MLFSTREAPFNTLCSFIAMEGLLDFLLTEARKDDEDEEEDEVTDEEKDSCSSSINKIPQPIWKVCSTLSITF